MELRDLVQAAVSVDMVAARQWVADARRAGFRWAEVRRPEGLDARELAVAAALVGLMAKREGVLPPGWVEETPAALESVWLIPSASRMPRLRRDIEAHCPEALRSKGVFATENYLTVA